MSVYTVHAPRHVGAPEADPMALVFVKEGFNWPALFFAWIWLIAQRMWLVLLLYLVAAAVLAVANQAMADYAVAVASIGFAVLFALEANNLRRWTLARAGWRMVGVVEGRNLVEAERRFFGRLLAGEPLAPGEDAGASPARQPAFPSSDAGPPVVGLFPQGQNAR